MMTDEQLEKLKAIRYFLLDMDGTIYLGGKILDGAREFLEYLAESGRKRLFFTNNCSVDAERYVEKLQGMGISATHDDILTSGEATARYLINETPYRRIYALGTPSLEAEFERWGLTLTNEQPDAVVLGFDKTLTYAKLETACILLREGSLPYIATNPDKVCPTETGYIPDCASMAALLFESTGRTPTYIGKPNKEMAQMGMDKLGASPDTTAMVGDRTYTDMQMAYNANLASILVLSGETKANDLPALDRQPDFVFDSVKALKEVLVTSG